MSGSSSIWESDVADTANSITSLESTTTRARVACKRWKVIHTNNVSFAVFHPNLPIIISGSEDGTVKIWNSGTYRIENTLSYALERSWCVALRKDANEVAVGFDEGVVVIKLGRDEPTFSMDPTGKFIYSRNHDVLSGNLQTISDPSSSPSTSFTDGTRLPLTTKEISSTEIFSTSLLHSPNGRFGNGISFAWAPDSNTYAVLESKVKLKVYKNFRERPGTRMKGSGGWSMESLHGGTLLGARGAGFVFWSGTGSLVAITAEDSFYILRFDRDAYNAKLEEGAEITDEGVEEAFEVVADVSEGIKTAKWVGDCFIYTTSNRLCYFVGSESYTISPFDTPLYLPGYIPSHNRVYLTDKDFRIYGYALSLRVVEYQTAILREDTEYQLNKVARFLEARDLKELALQIRTDPNHKFDLALSLDDLDTALQITHTIPENESEIKWRALGDRALTVCRFDLAKECFEKAGDLSASILPLLAVGDRDVGWESW
ncbi:hypothetical protein BYT27DRAFT_7266764 [Phlegmacium glaucopus]|nr:hypothetical protein BYT27DRAFT_7266764 [Phlegmacium glaucopus]